VLATAGNSWPVRVDNTPIVTLRGSGVDTQDSRLVNGFAATDLIWEALKGALPTPYAQNNHPQSGSKSTQPTGATW
jgi:hypothetical protein